MSSLNMDAQPASIDLGFSPDGQARIDSNQAGADEPLARKGHLARFEIRANLLDPANAD